MQDETYPQADRSTIIPKGRLKTRLRADIEEELDFYFNYTGEINGEREYENVTGSPHFERQDRDGGY